MTGALMRPELRDWTNPNGRAMLTGFVSNGHRCESHFIEGHGLQLHCSCGLHHEVMWERLTLSAMIDMRLLLLAHHLAAEDVRIDEVPV